MRITAENVPWTDVAQAFATGQTIAVLPFGALEQHGPHLPLATDTLTAQRVAESVADHFSAVLLPAVPYGDTWNNSGYPGTVSLSASTVTAIAIDLGRALHAQGCRALVIVNGDWGNRQPLYSATRTLLESGFPTITLDYPGMPDAIERVIDSAPAAPGLHHAEEVETSIMLALRPELVRSEEYVVCYPEFPVDFGIRPMKLHQFSSSGVFGDPRAASAQKGSTLLAATAAASIDAVSAMLEATA